MLECAGFCADESRCREEEGQRVNESADAEINLYCNESLPQPMNSPSVLTPYPAEKLNTRRRHENGIDFEIFNFVCTSSKSLLLLLLF